MMYSAAMLVKKSASQLLWMMSNKQEREITPRMVTGDAHAVQVTAMHNAMHEKRGRYSHDDDIMFFSIDAVIDNSLFVEIKYVEDPFTYEQWYLNSSILQSSLYATLLTNVTKLDTPSFLRNTGEPNVVIDVPKDHRFELWFGKDKYHIPACEKVLNFYLKKMAVVSDAIPSLDYQKCREFDSLYKWKEYEILSPPSIKL